MKLIHVTTPERYEQIAVEGLQPRAEKRGLYADSEEPAIYFFEDYDTAYDALTNWLADLIKGQWAVILEVEVNPTVLSDDPELAGSYMTTRAIAPEHIRLLERMDLGPEEEEDEEAAA